MIKYNEFLKFRTTMKNKRRIFLRRLFKSNIKLQIDKIGSEL